MIQMKGIQSLNIFFSKHDSSDLETSLVGLSTEDDDDNLSVASSGTSSRASSRRRQERTDDSSSVSSGIQQVRVFSSALHFSWTCEAFI